MRKQIHQKFARWVVLIVIAASLALAACAPTTPPVPTPIFPVIQMTPSLTEPEWLSEVQKAWNAETVYFRAIDTPDQTKYLLGTPKAVGEVMTGYWLNEKGEMVVDGINYGIVGAELSPNTRKAAFLVSKDAAGVTRSYLISELPGTDASERNFALLNVKGEQVGVLRIVQQTIDGVTGEFLYINMSDPKDPKKDVLLRGFASTASPASRPTPVPLDMLGALLNINVTPVRAEAPTSTPPPTPTGTATPTGEATATKPAITATKEAETIPNFKMATSWSEYILNKIGYPVTVDDLESGKLAETVKKQILPDLIKQGKILVPKATDKPYPVGMFDLKNGVFSLDVKVEEMSGGSRAYRPVPLGFVAVMMNEAQKQRLIAAGVKDNLTGEFWSSVLVLYWRKDPQTQQIEPVILTYWKTTPLNETETKLLNLYPDSIYPYVRMSVDNKYVSEMNRAPLSAFDEWVQTGYSPKELERFQLLPSAYRLQWP